MAFRNNKGLSLSDQVDSALNDLFNLDSLTAQIKAVASGHEHTVELLVRGTGSCVHRVSGMRVSLAGAALVVVRPYLVGTMLLGSLVLSLINFRVSNSIVAFRF